MWIVKRVTLIPQRIKQMHMRCSSNAYKWCGWSCIIWLAAKLRKADDGKGRRQPFSYRSSYAWSAFTLLAWLVIILNNARQLFDFLGTAQHSALRARLHRGHAGHGWGDMSFISWWSSSFALGSRCCQRRLKERNKAECGRMWRAVFWISLIGQLVYKRRHDNVRMYRQCQGMNVSWYESKCYILQRTVLVRFDGEGCLRSWSYFCVGLEMRPSLENYMQMRIKCI